MRLVNRKTNVRRHNRTNKHVVATVRNHNRNLRGRAVLGTIALKGLKTKEAKRIFLGLNPYGDIDGDGVVNSRDCRPFDVDRQDEEEYTEEHNRLTKEAWEDIGREADERGEKEWRKERGLVEREAEQEAEARAEDAMFNTDRRRRSPD